jgi:hypothetical protein
VSSIAIACSTISIALLLVENASLPVGLGVGVVIVPLGACVLVFRDETRGRRVDIRVLAIAIGALDLVVAPNHRLA